MQFLHGNSRAIQKIQPQHVMHIYLRICNIFKSLICPQQVLFRRDQQSQTTSSAYSVTSNSKPFDPLSHAPVISPMSCSRHDSAPFERSGSSSGNVGIGIVLEWDPDYDKHTVKRFMPNGSASLSGCLQVRISITRRNGNRKFFQLLNCSLVF